MQMKAQQTARVQASKQDDRQMQHACVPVLEPFHLPWQPHGAAVSLPTAPEASGLPLGWPESPGSAVSVLHCSSSPVACATCYIDGTTWYNNRLCFAMTRATTGHMTCHIFNDQVWHHIQGQLGFCIPSSWYLPSVMHCMCPANQKKNKLSESRKRITSMFVVCSAISALSDSSFCSSSLNLVLAVRWTARSALVSLAMPCRFSLKAAIDTNCRRDHCHCHICFMLSTKLNV